MFPMRVEGAAGRRAFGSARRPMPKQWVSRTFRTYVPGIQASGLRRRPVVRAISGPVPRGRGLRCAVDAGRRLVDGAGRRKHAIPCPRLPKRQTAGHRHIPAQDSLTSDGFLKVPDHAGPRGPGNPAIDNEVLMAFDGRRRVGRIRSPQVRNDSSLARRGHRVADSSAGHDR
jgi:hypothetical protein